MVGCENKKSCVFKAILGVFFLSLLVRFIAVNYFRSRSAENEVEVFSDETSSTFSGENASGSSEEGEKLWDSGSDAGQSQGGGAVSSGLKNDRTGPVALTLEWFQETLQAMQKEGEAAEGQAQQKLYRLFLNKGRETFDLKSMEAQLFDTHQPTAEERKNLSEAWQKLLAYYFATFSSKLPSQEQGDYHFHLGHGADEWAYVYVEPRPQGSEAANSDPQQPSKVLVFLWRKDPSTQAWKLLDIGFSREQEPTLIRALIGRYNQFMTENGAEATLQNLRAQVPELLR